MNNREPSPYVLFDRDGTLIKFEHYLIDPEKVELAEEAVRGLQILKDCGFLFGIVTNQSVIGRGLASIELVEEVNQRVVSLLAKNGIDFEFVLLCPHVPEDFCSCRKPEPELGRIAIREYGLSPNLSYMIGDTLSDIQFGHAIGCKSIQIGGEIEDEYRADHYAENLLAAAQWIASETKGVT
jgi:histidinol-phosphate phosphatase family protein